MHDVNQLESAFSDLKRAVSLKPYEAVDVAWVAIIKMANLLPGKSEHLRLKQLLEKLPDDQIKILLKSPAVEELLNLDPPLESLMYHKHERLNFDRTRDELEVVKAEREENPKLALEKLAYVLKRIRNRRAHGFKTPEGPRDQQILSATTQILQELGKIAVEVLRP